MNSIDAEQCSSASNSRYGSEEVIVVDGDLRGCEAGAEDVSPAGAKVFMLNDHLTLASARDRFDSSMTFFVADAKLACLVPSMAGTEVNFEMEGIDLGSRPLARTVQGMAADLVQSIRCRQPDGPYRLVGCGLASPVAYEIAMQLAGADEDVQFLGMVESPDAVSSGGLREGVGEYVPELPCANVHWFGSRQGVVNDLSQEWSRVLRSPRSRFVSVNDERTANADPVKSLGTSIREQMSSAVKSGAPREPTHSALVTIHAGRAGAIPLFCVPGAGGSVVDFLALAADVGDDRNVYGFQPRGKEGEFVPHSSVEAAANAYLRELMQARPHGAVHLLGHSFGGWIALEVAIRLRALGRRVASLTILDSQAPRRQGYHGREYTNAEALMGLVRLYEQSAEKSLGIELSDFTGLMADERIALLHRRLVDGGIMPSRTRPDVLRGTVRCFSSAIRTRYLPAAVCDAKAQLIVVRREDETPEDSQVRILELTSNWRSVVPEMDVHEVDGNHMTLLRRPNVAAVAKLLQGMLAAEYDH